MFGTTDCCPVTILAVHLGGQLKKFACHFV